jgi:orotidine-5'-phosphate decarboxylase
VCLIFFGVYTMTELIVALDGIDPDYLMSELYLHAGVRWFKIGPQAMTSIDWYFLVNRHCHARAHFTPEPKIFLDLKLADTRDTVTEAIKRFAQAGVNAVSTFTRHATEAAWRAAEGTELQVWEVVALTDELILNSIHESWAEARDRILDQFSFRYPRPHGIVCPGFFAESALKRFPAAASKKMNVIVPGARLSPDGAGGHFHSADVSTLPLMGATYAVVGRPIWSSSDPVARAIAYKAALRDTTGKAFMTDVTGIEGSY